MAQKSLKNEEKLHQNDAKACPTKHPINLYHHDLQKFQPSFKGNYLQQ
jgi:hypothetical protein